MPVPASARRPHCRVITTGGTIAMRRDPATGAAVPALSGAELIGSIAGLDGRIELSLDELFNLPSDHIQPAHWRQLHDAAAAAVRRDDVDGVVITHGTDTLEETAWFLDRSLDSAKPVVLTGAQRDPTHTDADGPRNLRCALQVCADPSASDLGVLVVLNEQIHAAQRVSKAHTTDVAGFRSGDGGLIGTAGSDGVRILNRPRRSPPLALGPGPLPRVDIVAMYAGADGALLRAALAAGARGIVVQALGMGNVNAALHEAIAETIRAGVPVVISTRVPRGGVRPGYGFAGGGYSLHEAGAILAGTQSPQKARITLMLALAAAMSVPQIRSQFES